jgi:hypothetical protein
MNKFSHIKWYEWIVFGLLFLQFSHQVCQIGWEFINADSDFSSPFIPIYSKWFWRLQEFTLFIPSIIGCIGLICILAKRKVGWVFALAACLVYEGLFFVPFLRGLFSGNFWSSFFFLSLIPTVSLVLIFLSQIRNAMHSNYKIYILAFLFSFLFLYVHHNALTLSGKMAFIFNA